MQTWFTFPDGAFSYDCAACRQRCCRGKGFAFAADELVPLLARAPTLGPHLQLRGGGAAAAGDPGTDALHAAWARAYQVDDAELARWEAATAPRVALLYPSLRWNALFHKGAPAYPKGAAELPRRLRALTFLGALAGRTL